MHKTKILVVEDDPITSSELKKALQKLEYEVTDVVKSQKAVLKSIKSKEPDIIMMDINLGPGGNGIEITRLIHKDKKIPVLYLTAFSDDDTMEEAFDTNPVGYLIKPFKREELKATISLSMYKIKKLEYESINENHEYIGFGYYFDIAQKKLYYKSKYIKLGQKERELLFILVTAEDETVPFNVIEHKLWSDNTPSSSSLRTIIYRLKLKLGCKIMEVDYSNGYRLAYQNSHT